MDSIFDDSTQPLQGLQMDSSMIGSMDCPPDFGNMEDWINAEHMPGIEHFNENVQELPEPTPVNTTSQARSVCAEDEISALRKHNTSLVRINDGYKTRIAELEVVEKEGVTKRSENEALKLELKAARKKIEWLEMMVTHLQTCEDLEN
jgi:hypothetical protein